MRCILALFVLTFSSIVLADDIDQAPIRYSTAEDENAITRLKSRIEKKEVTIRHRDEHGYLVDFLKSLDIPVSSQTFVFSKTSLQRNRISPKTPRALYFNDDTYVGFCLHGNVMEISTTDPKLGTAFYTLDQFELEKPTITRQTESCLICHSSSSNQGFPGHLMRSVYSDSQGHPVLASGTYRTTQNSPFSQRWGGWYVTGTSGKQLHMGNLIVGHKQRVEEDLAPGSNVTDLSKKFTTGFYLSPHSDIVALLVLEHQAEMHNRLSRANLQCRIAEHDEEAYNEALKRPKGYRSEGYASRIRSIAEPIVECMLFAGATPLQDTIQGTSDFAKEFSAKGIQDKRGRHLKQFNLKSRLFEFPCSYLIYSSAFDDLPRPVLDYVYQRLWNILQGKETSKPYQHLTESMRKDILDILQQTKRSLPAYWKS